MANGLSLRRMEMSRFFVKHVGLVLGLSLGFLAIVSCEKESDLVERDPTIDLVFYNIDSLVQVEDTLEIVADSIEVLTDTLTHFADSASVLTDSIAVLNQLISQGDDSLIATRDELLEERRLVNLDYAYFDQQDSIMNVSKKKWTSVQTTINSGDLLVSSITNKANNRTLYYTDSAIFWSVPLDMNSDFSLLSVEIDGEFYDLDIYRYSKNIVTDEYSNVLIETYGFDERNMTHTFDSLQLNCKTSDCFDFESSIYIYF
ncbi:hypothetical protein [Reichenbachiella sp. MSK19-1]|uniref:hypothetical protein n=1 Tax=Reichenbachiella sp. MSK19-1 TaxID=1897631 RepID=UPI0011C48804|nr:hypothetical protein [Reichenbachiella sp. MSK19-1]